MVFDELNLRYYAINEGENKVTVVGDTFEPLYYGMAVPQGSPLRERVNRVLLEIAESGESDKIWSKWFGEEDS